MKQQDDKKPSAKIRKCDDDSNENKKDINLVPPMSPKAYSIFNQKSPKPSTSQSPKVASSPHNSLSSQSNLQKKQDISNSLQSFFKERAQVS